MSARIVILVTGRPVGDVAQRRGEYDRWIRDAAGGPAAARWTSHDVRTNAPLPGVRDADAFVITGSSSSVTERTPWMNRTEDLVRGVVAARVPLLGVCFGHQIIAQALGGEVRRNPRGREIGTVRLTRCADDPLFFGLPRSFDVNASHVDSVSRLPPGAEVLATTALDPVAAFRVGDRVRAVQFHPEFDADVMRGYLQARADLVQSEGGNPGALLAAVHDGTPGRDVLRNFVSLARDEGGVARA